MTATVAALRGYGRTFGAIPDEMEEAPTVPSPHDAFELPFVADDRRARWLDVLHDAESAAVADHVTRDKLTNAVDGAVEIARAAIEALEELQAAIGYRP